jgi:beige protein homolog 1
MLTDQCARINDVTGNIMLCRENRISLLTLNGALLLNQKVCDHDDRIISCAFYEGASNEWLEKELLFTGHKRGVVKVRMSDRSTFWIQLKCG